MRWGEMWFHASVIDAAATRKAPKAAIGNIFPIDPMGLGKF
jgi:hypothetical protein